MAVRTGANAAAIDPFNPFSAPLSAPTEALTRASLSISAEKPSLMAFLNLLKSTNSERMPRPYLRMLRKDKLNPPPACFALRPSPNSAFPARVASVPMVFNPFDTARPLNFASCMAAFFAPAARRRRKRSTPGTAIFISAAAPRPA